MGTRLISVKVSTAQYSIWEENGGQRWLRRTLSVARKMLADPMHQAKVDAKIVDEYRRGVPVEMIRAEHQTDVPRILRAVDAAGVPRRGRGYRKVGDRAV